MSQPHLLHDDTLSARVLEYVERHRSALPLGQSASIAVSFYKRGFLSTMFLIEGGDHPLLFSMKHHDDNARRVQREFEVLEALRGRFAPLAYLVDTGGSWFSDAILITGLVEPALPISWDPSGLRRLATVTAELHMDGKLMELDIDRGRTGPYSLYEEFAEEAAVIPTFRAGELRDCLVEVAADLEGWARRWDPSLAEDTVVYIHGDLPHSHYHLTPDGPKLIHWEFSRRSHPTRELGRAAANLVRYPGAARVLVEEYARLVPFRIDHAAIEIQELLQYFYESIHVAFWLDRSGDAAPKASIERAVRDARLLRLYFRNFDGRLSVAGDA
jgi:aminoglycoside phosphotransferase (APT) family kinase protein